MLNSGSPILLTYSLDLAVGSSSGNVFKGDHINTGHSQHISKKKKHKICF